MFVKPAMKRTKLRDLGRHSFFFRGNSAGAKSTSTAQKYDTSGSSPKKKKQKYKFKGSCLNTVRCNSELWRLIGFPSYKWTDYHLPIGFGNPQQIQVNVWCSVDSTELHHHQQPKKYQFATSGESEVRKSCRSHCSTSWASWKFANFRSFSCRISRAWGGWGMAMARGAGYSKTQPKKNVTAEL